MKFLHMQAKYCKHFAFVIFLFLLITNVNGQTLWGYTRYGGNYFSSLPNNLGDGTIFSITTGGSSINTAYHFDHNALETGYAPTSLLLASDGFMYGMSTENNNGILFQFNPVTHNCEKKITIPGFYQSQSSSLTQASNGKIYGTTMGGGFYNMGTLFEYDINSNTLTIKHEFDGSDGGSPHEAPIQASNGKLYGLTQYGGAYTWGVLYEFDIANNSFSKKIDLDRNTTGSEPFGQLLEASPGKLFGLTQSGGGEHDQGIPYTGVLFEFNINNNVYNVRHRFDGITLTCINNTCYGSGANPLGSLIKATNGKLYGMVGGGGVYEYPFTSGVIFEFDPNSNIYTPRIYFPIGISSDGNLTQSVNGNLYTMVSNFPSGCGQLIEFNPANNFYSVKASFSGSNGCYSAFANLIELNCTPPTISFSGLPDTICVNAGLVTLTGTPAGGSFTGPGISGNTFNPALAGAGGPYTITYNYANVNGCLNSTSQTVSVSACITTTTLKLKVFLEGYYTGAGSMAATLFDLGISTDPSETDSVTVNLWAPVNLANQQPDFSQVAVLHTDGTATIEFPVSVSGNSYYLAVKHRNHVETWSKQPVTLSQVTEYDFSTSVAMAYDDGFNPPMSEVVAGVYALYSGDVNQDGGIDASDNGDIDNDNSIFAFGYNVTDINGDGTTDASDLAIADNNSQLFIFYARPF